MTAYPTTPGTWAEANALLGKRDSRKVGNNTYVQRRSNGFALRLHNTDIVGYHPNGVITLHTGGWVTVTTKDRLNSVLRRFGWNITQRNHQWTVHNFQNGITTPFTEGFVLPTGGAAPATPAFAAV